MVWSINLEEPLGTAKTELEVGKRKFLQGEITTTDSMTTYSHDTTYSKEDSEKRRQSLRTNLHER